MKKLVMHVSNPEPLGHGTTVRLARPPPPPTATTDIDYQSTAQTVAMAAATATTIISKR